MFATILLPNFYLQAALRHQPELQSQPVGLIDGGETKAVLLQINHAAESRGVRAGMTPTQGLARSLELVVKTRDLEQENLATRILLEAAGTLAPLIEDTAPGICTVQFTDDRDLEPKLARVIENLAQLHLAAQAAIAATPDASLLGAHLAKSILRIDDATKFLAPLPIETLLE